MMIGVWPCGICGIMRAFSVSSFVRCLETCGCRVGRRKARLELSSRATIAWQAARPASFWTATRSFTSEQADSSLIIALFFPLAAP